MATQRETRKYSENWKIKCTLDNTKSATHRKIVEYCDGFKFTFAKWMRKHFVFTFWGEARGCVIESKRQPFNVYGKPEQLKTFWHALSISVQRSI